MLPELGYFALILALCFALMQGALPLLGHRLLRSQQAAQEICIIAAIGQFIFLSLALLCLMASFILNDMTVVFVREHSHELLPLLYRIGATWGGHEGSLLLWCVILSGWTVAFALCAYRNQALKQGRFHGTFVHILMVLGTVSIGFITFLIMTSNPFLRDFPNAPITGNDLTPLLQDPGLIFHPPMLYLGYVGFTIGFAFAIAALIEGGLNAVWARACRPWIVLPWCCLGCGIVLGSWWAYRELGWGGWWFWDPVENASLMPWLVGTALIHSLIVTEKCDVFKGWTVLLAIIAFGLSLIGTFLVRSGVLVSVHAFANDPARGVFLLLYIATLLGGALMLYAYRIKQFYRPPHFTVFSREALLLVNSVLLLTVMGTILLGTLYPILLDALSGEKISVGEPYFNVIFMPIMLLLLIVMGIAPHVHWKIQSLRPLWQKLRATVFLSVLIGILAPQLAGFKLNVLASIGTAAGVWALLATLQYVWRLWRIEHRIRLHHGAMVLAHIGIAIIVIGISFNKSYSEERQVKIKTGETVTLAGYQFYFANVHKIIAPNFTSINTVFKVTGPHFSGQLSADQRIYASHQQSFSKPGVLYNPWRDLYLALGTVFPDGSWSVRLYYKPCVRWIWWGGFLIVLSGAFTFFRPHFSKKATP